ncbi:MAG TPA: DinB family protein [Acidobacteriaceae bacterium]|nr:DinB family protein [Acidobacteriaceae bacterium]
MHELALTFIGDSAHTPPSHILEAVPGELAHAHLPGATHTIYEELWHLTYWQQVMLDRVNGCGTPSPDHNSASFPTTEQSRAEPWADLCRRFLAGANEAAALVDRGGSSNLDKVVLCPSPENPARSMTVREQLESFAAHNAYHFGRIVQLRQMLGSWPPPSGGLTW